MSSSTATSTKALVRLAAMMEGQSGPLADLLAKDANNRGGLAERIRMLQARGVRVTGEALGRRLIGQLGQGFKG